MDYIRVVSPEEYLIIKATNKIPTNKTDWPPYSCGEVVFLFNRHEVPFTSIQSLVDEIFESGSEFAVIVHFSCLLKNIENDESGKSWKGNCVHRGEIDLINANVKYYILNSPKSLPLTLN